MFQLKNMLNENGLENFLREKFSSFIRIDETGDPNIDSMTNSDYSKEIWGDGELRYLISK